MNRFPLSVSFMPLETRHDVILHVALKAEELGYEGFMMPETWSYDMMVLLTEIAMKTTRLRVGTGVISMWGRTPAALAMSAATLNLVSGGRFSLGLGASSPQLTEGLHDTTFEKPLSRLRQTLIQLRALLNGERIPLQNKPDARPLKLNLPPQPDLPIYLGASAENSIRLAGELADGWIPFLVPYDSLPGCAEILREGIAESAVPDRVGQILMPVPVMVDENEDKARAAMAWFLAFYMTMMGPVYPKTLARLGYGEEVAAIQQANQSRQPSVVPPDAEELLHKLTVFGRPDSVKSQLDTWFEHGATNVTLLLNPGLEKEQYDLILESFII
jgi:alkanesulfonate monooxygenase SsuD/methylene tetrahydromethanopterin reductase-like flavin-dependent oxidoreductase (luciferase family)